MDPITWLWTYESWCRDQEEENEFAKSYAVLGGSAANPEWARRIMKAENPDFETSDEDFEKISKEILEENRKSQFRRKRRNKIIDAR